MSATLTQQAWTDEAEKAFVSAYADARPVNFHADAVRAGREVLFKAEGLGFMTAEVDSLDGARRIVVTGAAGEAGGFDAVLDTLEANFAVVCVETYRDGLLEMLKARGYEVDHVRVFKRV